MNGNLKEQQIRSFSGENNNGKKEKRIIKNCYNCEKIHTNKVKIKSYSIV